MVNAVVFDLGKVLVDFDYLIAARRVAARSRMAAGEIISYLASSALMHDYEKGLVTRQRFFEEIRAATGFAGSLEEFGEYFSDIFTEIEPMVRLHAALRARHLSTYIFSNTNDLAVTHIRRRFPFFSRFDGYIYSYEHHVLKPDSRLYEVVERIATKRGAEILFLDDRPENIQAGAARGWQVVLQETPEKTWSEIRKLGLVE